MPLDSVRQTIHIRRKKNQVVFHNIARLWDLARNSHSHQDLLDGLHPWNAPITLKFENIQPILLGICGIFISLMLFIQPAAFWAQLCLLAGLLMIFWAFISYENDDPVEEVIAHLEKEAIAKKYQLNFQRQPQHLSVPLNSVLFISQLKQMFPVFSQGNISNDFPWYASTVWQDDQGKDHQVMLFQYRYINEIRAKDKDGNDIKIKEVQRDLWGVFIFDIETRGLAVTTANKSFYYPYSFPWQTSDIQSNEKLRFFGSDRLEVVKLLTPAMVLKLSDFFAQRHGDLMFHPDKNMLCFLGPSNLFHMNSRNTKKIEDISALRGHLRTFNLPYLEKLQHDLTQFLK
ncbi:hypothetical protein QR674_12505 [Acinetobacter chinensis]|uniref:DUF3137 domain-containing protein n=1 Tax=Acinetobacter chinensis TaxID=2004650 RepID=A0ABU3WHC3_9GAMM|nr:hypothetical protein [Acinetobacter chinensis]MDV2469803.1 hypothetical protein [Acinetobacter chinensis]